VRTGKVATVVAAASVCVALLTGCGGDSGDEGEPFEGQSADDTAAKAVEATRQAKSMRVKGDTRLEDGSTVTIDVSVDQEKNCQGTTGAGETRADVRHTATLYLRGDEQYWQTALKQQPDAARKMAPKLRDKWVRMPADDASTAGVCDKQGFVAAMEGEPYILKTTTEGGKNPGSVTFSEYGETVSPEQPPAGETVDMKELAGEQQTRPS
jgi:hypothetical protein